MPRDNPVRDMLLEIVKGLVDGAWNAVEATHSKEA